MRLLQFVNDLPLKRKLLLVTLATCTAALALACSALFWFQSVILEKVSAPITSTCSQAPFWMNCPAMVTA